MISKAIETKESIKTSKQLWAGNRTCHSACSKYPESLKNII